MRFEDERYVRIFTRDTMTWLMLPWQSKCVLPLVARKLDRAGVLDMGEHGLAGLAVMIQVPGDIVEPGILGATAAKVLEIRDSLLVWPRFLEAQEARQSDKARAKAARERARDLSRAESQGVTVASQNVTEPTAGERERHTPSHDVTPSRTVLSRTDLKTKDLSVGEPTTPPDPISETKIRKPTPADEAYEHWLVERKRFSPRSGRIEMNDKDRKALMAMIKRGRSVDEMKLAFTGHFLSPHHNGSDGGTKYLGFTYAIRDGNIDTFIALGEREQAKRAPIVEAPLPTDAPVPIADREARAKIQDLFADIASSQTSPDLARNAEEDLTGANVRWSPKRPQGAA